MGQRVTEEPSERVTDESNGRMTDEPLERVTREPDGRETDGLEDGVERTSVTRSGFVALAGRPNVGKSTLVNVIVGGKVAIVSDRPQTTRRAIRGVRTDLGSQLVLVDLPGVQRPRDALTERMAGRVREELEGSDAALLVLNGEQGVGPGDRYIAQALSEAKAPVAIAVNKVDRLNRAATVAMLAATAQLEVGEEIFPISARTGKGVEALVEYLAALMPPGPFMFPQGALSDQPLPVCAGRAGERGRDQAHLPRVAPRPGDDRRRGRTPPRWLDSGQGFDLGRERVPEGDRGRGRWAHDQGDWDRRTQGNRTRASLPSPPRPVGARQA